MRAFLLIAVVFLRTVSFAVTFEERLVAAVLMAEARGDGVVGMTAVGEVIATRALKRSKSPSEVVREANQFSPLNRTKPHKLVARYEQHPLFAEALRIAQVVVNTPDRLPMITDGADHFERIQARTPFWARGRRPVAVIGGHRFWRLYTGP